MNFNELLKEINDNQSISDLHLTVNSYPVVREDGKLRDYEEANHKYDAKELENIAKEILSDKEMKQFKEKGEVDFSYSLKDIARFRVNVYKQKDYISMALRVIPHEVPTIEDLGLPSILQSLSIKRQGLILCTGPTGSGKSTTLASMINHINQNKNVHIITLEDPIEFLHSHQNSIVHQREIGRDTANFANGLRAALRQDPDVILVGEMRDLETISIALEAAETGHLVMATLHTNNAPKTIDRIIDVFPSHQQEQVKTQLASTISGVISQMLLPRKEGGRVAALEVLIGSPAVKNIVREGKSHQLKSAMQTGGKYGMIVMDNYLLELYKKGQITKKEALLHSDDPEHFKRRVGN